MKLFNLLMAQLGPDFLRKGIYVSCFDLMDFLAGQDMDFWQGCRQVLLDGKPTITRSLEDIAWLSHHDRVFLSVVIEKGTP